MSLFFSGLKWFHQSVLSLFPPGEGIELSDRPWAEALGLTGLLVLAIGVPLGKSIQLVGIFMMFIAFCASWPNTKHFIKTDPVVKLVALFLLYAWGRTLWEVGFGAGDAEASKQLVDYARKHTYILFLPAVAWWMGASRRTLFSFYAVIAAGLIFHILFYSNLSMDTMLQGRRAMGGSESLSGLLRKYAFLCSLVVIWLILFSDKIAGFVRGRFSLFTIMRAVLWIMSVILVMIMILTLQARSALVLTIFFLLVSAAIVVVRSIAITSRKRINKAYLLLFGIALVSFAFLIYTNGEYVSDRFAKETPVIQEFLAGEDISELELSSFSIRLWLLLEGWDFFLDKPVFGHASGNIRLMIGDAEMSGIRNAGHLHNTYIELLASWGIVGFSLIALIVIYSMYYLFHYRRSNTLDFQTWLFLFIATLLLLAGGLDQSFFVRQHGWIFFIIIMAPACSFGGHYRCTGK